MPAEETINTIITYITTQVPGILPAWFHYEPEQFRPRLADAMKIHRAAEEASAARAQALGQKPDYGAVNQQLAQTPLTDADFGPQLFARTFVADYLIFRSIVSNTPEEWSFAHMRIYEPQRPNGACWFKTRSPSDDDSTGDHLVSGIFYEPQRLPKQLFTVARYVEQDGDKHNLTTELRATYLISTRRPGLAGSLLDLCGARLGPGRVMAEPRAYAIWCARLERPLGKDEQFDFVKQFPKNDGQRMAIYEAIVPGLQTALNWVQEQKFLSIQPPA